MRALAASVIMLISLSFLGMSAPTAGVAEEAAAAKAAAEKAPRMGPDGVCVSTANLPEICGSPSGGACKQEAVARVCFGRQ